MSDQLKAWSGDFGAAYTDRNPVDWRTVVPFMRPMLEGLPVRSALEVGCNRGHNLLACREILGADAALVGIEPNPYARGIAQETGVDARPGDALALPVPDAAFDLVFTAGVLIHVALADLPTALREILRATRRYVLAVEYFAAEETSIPYQGHTGLLWKRNFLAHYKATDSTLRVLRQGYLEAWDRSTWWLMERP